MKDPNLLAPGRELAVPSKTPPGEAAHPAPGHETHAAQPPSPGGHETHAAQTHAAGPQPPLVASHDTHHGEARAATDTPANAADEVGAGIASVGKGVREVGTGIQHGIASGVEWADKKVDGALDSFTHTSVGDNAVGRGVASVTSAGVHFAGGLLKGASSLVTGAVGLVGGAVQLGGGAVRYASNDTYRQQTNDGVKKFADGVAKDPTAIPRQIGHSVKQAWDKDHADFIGQVGGVVAATVLTAGAATAAGAAGETAVVAETAAAAGEAVGAGTAAAAGEAVGAGTAAATGAGTAAATGEAVGAGTAATGQALTTRAVAASGEAADAAASGGGMFSRAADRLRSAGDTAWASTRNRASQMGDRLKDGLTSSTNTTWDQWRNIPTDFANGLRTNTTDAINRLRAFATRESGSADMAATETPLLERGGFRAGAPDDALVVDATAARGGGNALIADARGGRNALVTDATTAGRAASTPGAPYSSQQIARLLAPQRSSVPFWRSVVNMADNGATKSFERLSWFDRMPVTAIHAQVQGEARLASAAGMAYDADKAFLLRSSNWAIQKSAWSGDARLLNYSQSANQAVVARFNLQMVRNAENGTNDAIFLNALARAGRAAS